MRSKTRTLVAVLAAAAFALAPAASATDPATADECAGGADASNLGDWTLAHELDPRATCGGMLHASKDRADWYTIEIPASTSDASTFVRMCPEKGDYYLQIWYLSGTERIVTGNPKHVRTSHSGGNGGCESVSDIRRLGDLPGGGLWLIGVTYAYGQSGAYTLETRSTFTPML